MQIPPDYSNKPALPLALAIAAPELAAHTRVTQNAVQAVNESELLGFDRELRFTQDPKTKRAVVKVINTSTGEILLQLPDETVIRIAEALKQQ